ncbi:MAG: carboxypeptidase-like regulatory domain-containing protein, partial [Flavobacteriales bacterium]
MRSILSIILVAFSIATFGQSTLRGQISDIESGELMVGVIVTLEADPLKGAFADLDGNYSLEGLTPGKQKFVFRFTAYRTDTISIDIKSGVNVYNHIMAPDGYDLGGVEIIGKASTANKSYLTAMQQKSAVVLDGTTNDQMKKMGDSDASSAVKR